MPAQTGYFDTLKSVAGKVFTYLASITLTGTDGKTITCTQDTSLDEAVAMSSKAPKASPTFTTKITTPIIDLTGGQIAFPAAAVPSADPNTLDDYEEGTWTPAIRGSTTAGTYELSTALGYYRKIGSFVYTNCNIAFAASITGGGAGALWITGLPFTPAVYSAQGSVEVDGVAYTANASLSAGFPFGNINLCILEMINNAGRGNLAITGVALNDVIKVTICYQI